MAITIVDGVASTPDIRGADPTRVLVPDITEGRRA